MVGAKHFFARYIREELSQRNITVKLLKDNLYSSNNNLFLATGSITSSNGDNHLEPNLSAVKAVISCIGGSTLFDLCTSYKNNVRLLQEARKINLEKIVFVFSTDCSLSDHTHVLTEKKRFLQELIKSKITYTIVKNHGLFSNFIDVLNMAQNGKVYLFGDVKKKFSPIHLKDLAIACVDAIEIKHSEVCIEGPEVLNLRKIAEIAVRVTQKPSKIIHLPIFIEKLLNVKKHFFKLKTNQSSVDFCMDITTQDCISKVYGTNSLEAYFNEEVKMF